MREIGVRELKAHLSEVLREVERGGQMRVTVRGRVVADIVPPGREPWEERRRALVAEGRITPASKPFPRHPPPKVRADRSAAGMVISERDEER
jgi:prevent-host-death family protein